MLEMWRRRYSVLAVAILGGGGCAGSTPRTLLPVGYAECKEDAALFMKEKLRLYADWGPAIRVNLLEESFGISEKAQMFFATSDWQPLPKGTRFFGQVLPGIHEGRRVAYVQLLVGYLPDGPGGSVCLCAVAPFKEDGWPERDLAFRPVKKLWEGCDAGNF